MNPRLMLLKDLEGNSEYRKTVRIRYIQCFNPCSMFPCSILSFLHMCLYTHNVEKPIHNTQSHMYKDCQIPCFCLVPFQSALGWDHQSELSKHKSQTDAVKGFGGKFGVQKDHQDQV